MSGERTSLIAAFVQERTDIDRERSRFAQSA